MKWISILTLLTLTSTLVCDSISQEKEDLISSKFQEFIDKHGKKYSSPSEHSKRHKNFKDNYLKMEAISSDPTNTFSVGVNSLSDLSPEEYKTRLGYKNNPLVPLNTLDTENLRFLQGIPAALDYTIKNAVTAVKNQGQCGSGWAFSAIANLEGAYAKKTGKLLDFSEQHLVSCSGSYGNQGCNLGEMEAAVLFIAQNGGIALEKDYPYTATDTACKSVTKVPISVAAGKYYSVPANNESAIIAALVKYGPLSAVIEADLDAFKLYSGGIFNNAKCGTQVDHAVTIVGYGPEHWKVKNSWGASWGDKGYILISRTGKGAGLCGIHTNVSTILLA